MADWVFWTVALPLAAAVVALLVQAMRRGRAEAAVAEADLAVYKDQLAEVDRDLARGTIASEEAARLRTEIGRRLLDLDRLARAEGSATASAPIAPVAVLVAVAVLGGSALVYWQLGAPGYPDLPIRTRIALADERLANRPGQAEAVASAPVVEPPADLDPAYIELMEKLRAAVQDRPDDLRGLELLARNETALGNFAAAEAAQRRLIAAKGETATASDHSALAEMMIAAAGGYVSPEAEAELTAALSRDPQDGLARYYAGLMFVQSGRYDRGFALWVDLLENGPRDAPWVRPLRAQIEEVAFRAGVRFQLPDQPGELPEGLSPESMVAQLAERLATQGGTIEEWDRLIRSLVVLERTDEAQAIYDEAKTRFEGRSVELSVLRQAAVESGLTP